MINYRWVERYFAGLEFQFKFWPFTFVEPWPGDGVTIHIYLMAAVAFLAMVGLFYRFSAALFFFLITYLFLLDQARYLNHLYLVCLLACLLIFVPAHHTFSVDALWRRKIASSTVPAWSLWILMFQVGIVYFYGGIAKLNGDWLQGEPLRDWLSSRTDFPLIGPLFTFEPVVWTMTYGALFLDLFVVFLLLFRRTRIFGFVGLLVFHFMNSRLFGIGIFPWTMIVATMLFFQAAWPRQMWTDIRSGGRRQLLILIVGFALGFLIGGYLPEDFSYMRALIGGLGVAVAAYHLDEPFRHRPGRATRHRRVDLETSGHSQPITKADKWIVLFLAFWVVLQLLIPLRHFLIPGDVNWTEEGHNFSWRMKLRDKDSEGYFVITDPVTGDSWEENPRDHLTSFQTAKMTSRPDLIVQFAHYLQEINHIEGEEDVEVRAEIWSSLNGRPAQPLVDPAVDLTKVPYPWLGPADWILPLTVPLADQPAD